MRDPSARLSLVRKLALACVLLVLAVTTLSAFIRLSRAGMGCEPWPQCHEQRAATSAQALAAADAPTVRMARIAHRIVASTALLVILVLLLQSLAMRPALRREGGLALALLALALFLAVLGRVGAESHAAPVVLGNLLGGLAMFALACRLLQVTGAARLGAAAQLRPWLLGALVLLALQLALGGLASSQQAAGRCTELGACQVHRLLGIAIAVLLAPLGAAAARAGQRIGVAIALLALLQVALGWVLGANASPLAVALAHNVLAVLLLGAVASAVVAPADPLPAVA